MPPVVHQLPLPQLRGHEGLSTLVEDQLVVAPARFLQGKAC